MPGIPQHLECVSDILLGIGPADMGDDQHMNTLGSTKYSAYIAGYLMDNYDLADRRGDDYYSSWDKTLEVWERTHK